MRILGRFVLSWNDEGPMEDYVLLVQSERADVGPCEAGGIECGTVLLISDPEGGDPDNPYAYCLRHAAGEFEYTLETYEQHFPPSEEEFCVPCEQIALIEDEGEPHTCRAYGRGNA